MDHFPSMVIPMTVSEMENSSATPKILRDNAFDSMGGMNLYQVCIKVINKDKLQCVDTPWRDHLNIAHNIKSF